MYTEYLMWKNFIFKIAADDEYITQICRVYTMDKENKSNLTSVCAKQLREYFNYERKTFQLPLFIQGTQFQKDVWAVLAEIPFGEKTYYKALAESMGKDNAYRAVGNAVGKNNFLIVLPCHRVLAANNRIGGFSCGLDLKESLLKHENIGYIK